MKGSLLKMSKIIIENLAKKNINRQEMIANGFKAQKYDDVQRGHSSYKLEDIIKISEKFQLSLDYLVYGKEKDIFTNISEDKQQLLNMYDLLTEREQGKVLGALEVLTHDRA